MLPMNSFEITGISTEKDQTIGQKLEKFCLPTSAYHTFDVKDNFFTRIPLSSETKIL